MGPASIGSQARRVFRALVLLAPLALPAAASGATPAPPAPQPARPPVAALGTLTQVRGPSGCLVDRSKRIIGCTSVRALRGPAPFVGSNAIAMSSDGTNVYVAASRSNAIVIFRRDATTGVLTQPSGSGGCIATGGSDGCAQAAGLLGPNSIAVSPDGRNVYATALRGDSVVSFRRNASTGALSQAGDGSGCIANAATAGCIAGRMLDGPDVVAISPDGRNVYVGSFEGDGVAVFERDSSSGALTQPSGATGCIVDAPAAGCAAGLALAAPEGMAISADGGNVYVASAGSGALDVFTRDRSSGALTQATDGTGCITDRPTAGCTTGLQLGGANAVAVSPGGGNVYVTSLFSNSVTTFGRDPVSGTLTQQTGTAGCLVYLMAVGCSLGRTLGAPEGLAASPDGASVYVMAFRSGAVGILDRNSASGAVLQKSRRPGCTVTRPAPDCTHARALLGASSVVVSLDGRYVYTAAFASDAVGVYARVTKSATR